MNRNKIFTYQIKRKFLYFLFAIAVLFLLSFIVLFLWNTILPKITGLGAINYWQAIGLLALCRLLFGGFSFGSIWGSQRKDGLPAPKDSLIDLDEADKAAFKEEWKKWAEQRGR